MTVGQITNHMSVDAYNMFFFSQRMHYLWAVPFRVSQYSIEGMVGGGAKDRLQPASPKVR